MTLVDLTHTLSESTRGYPGKTGFSKEIQAYYENMYSVIDIHHSTGIGTHMDAPSHFFAKMHGIDIVPLAQCHGPAYVLH